MKFSELYSGIMNSIEDMQNKFNIKDDEISIKSSNNPYAVLGVYSVLEDTKKFCIVLDSDTEMKTIKDNPNLCKYVDTISSLKLFKKWIDNGNGIGDPECFDISKGNILKICGFKTLIKYNCNEKPKIEIYINSKMMTEEELSNPSTYYPFLNN